MACREGGNPVPKYLKKRGSKFHFQRRIPKQYQHQFSKPFVQISLDTDSEIVALQRAHSLNLILVDFWTSIRLESSQKEVDSRFEKAVHDARRCGFQYVKKDELLNEVPLAEFVNRLNVADAMDDIDLKKALLGGIEESPILLSEAARAFFAFEKGNLSGNSENQLRKWENPRKKAIKNFVKLVGNKPVKDISRKDILDFRTYWVGRIKNEGMAANSANKEFSFIRQILKSANNDHSLGLSINDLFEDIRLKEEEKKARHPYKLEFIRNLVFKDWLDDLNEEARLLIYAMIDTGARISELTGLDEKNGDIILHEDIPYIRIRNNSIRKLKTAQSERDLPLVGASLVAFQRLGGGFKRYLGKRELVSTTINKYFREKGLQPSENHSLYSLRHSFEDRLTAVEPPEKVQAILMGHKYIRERYGLGPSLEQKRFWLNKIAIKI